MNNKILETPYPGSPGKGTLAFWDDELNLYRFRDNKFNSSVDLFLVPTAMDYSNWVDYIPIELIPTLGSFVFMITNQFYGIYELLHTKIENGEFYLVCTDLILTSEQSFLISTFNKFFEEGGGTEYETVEEAFTDLKFKAPLFSLEEISEIYSSATNPQYEQSLRLTEKINSKIHS